MAGTKDSIRINLTPEQRELVRKATGKNAEALEVTARAGRADRPDAVGSGAGVVTGSAAQRKPFQE